MIELEWDSFRVQYPALTCGVRGDRELVTEGAALAPFYAKAENKNVSFVGYCWEGKVSLLDVREPLYTAPFRSRYGELREIHQVYRLGPHYGIIEASEVETEHELDLFEGVFKGEGCSHQFVFFTTAEGEVGMLRRIDG
jgi:hypothetical protein